MGTPNVISDDSRTASEGTVLSASVSPDQVNNEPDDYDSEREPWCHDFENHKPSHEFCSDHQAMWCRLCDEGQCPDCVHDPHCRYCHCALFEEYHNWDCLYAGDEDR